MIRLSHSDVLIVAPPIDAILAQQLLAKTHTVPGLTSVLAESQ